MMEQLCCPREEGGERGAALRLGDFLAMLSWKELKALAKILEVDVARRRKGIEEAIIEASAIRWRIWVSSGLRVKVSRKARYDGWKFCSRCGLSFKYVSNVSNEGRDKCPLCHGLLRHHARFRKKK